MLAVHRESRGADGFVSLEVSPELAHDTQGTLAEARRLWRAVDRPNLMIKVPGTPEGAIALRRLIADGINVNVTLLFAVEAHGRIIEAYLAGLEDRFVSPWLAALPFLVRTAVFTGLVVLGLAVYGGVAQLVGASDLRDLARLVGRPRAPAAAGP
mgnify:CR=1 FL=1